MKIEEVSVIRSLGKRLLNDIRLDTGLLPRGHVVTEEDVLMFQIMGLKRINTVEIENGDVDLKTAEGVVAAKVCGENTAYSLSEQGVLKVVAAVDGHFSADEKRCEKFNAFQKNIILNTIPCYSFVKKGEVVAKLDFTLPLYDEAEINAIALNLSGNTPLLSVDSVRKRKVGLVYVKFYNDSQEKEKFTKSLSKLISETKSLKLDFSKEYFAEYSVASIADAIDSAVLDGSEVVLLISALKNVGTQDVLFRAIQSTSDEILTEYVDVAEASDLILATKKSAKIVSLPLNYEKVKSSFLTEMIFKVIVKEKPVSLDFYVRNNIFEEKNEKIESSEEKKLIYTTSKTNDIDGEIAIVVLAAGASLRAGKDKLMQDYQGRPLFYHAVSEAIKSKAGPVFLVTGAKHEEMSEAVKSLDINIIHNISYREGVKSSIRLGLNHVPNLCKGAILFPADMPNITAAHLNKMMKAFDKTADKQVVITSYDGLKYNPIMWSKSLFSRADVVPENSGVRPILVEFEDVTQLVKVKAEKDIFDVTYPADIQKISKS